MTDQPAPEKIKAFLDDLARISLRHGMYIGKGSSSCGLDVYAMNERFVGYIARNLNWGGRPEADIWPSDGAGGPYPNPLFPQGVSSLDLTQLSNHEKLEIMGGRG